MQNETEAVAKVQKPEPRLKAVEIEVADGVKFHFDSMSIDNDENLSLFNDAWNAEGDDFRKLTPRFRDAVRRELATRYSAAEVDIAMTQIRISMVPNSPWSRIVSVLIGNE